MDPVIGSLVGVALGGGIGWLVAFDQARRGATAEAARWQRERDATLADRHAAAASEQQRRWRQIVYREVNLWSKRRTALMSGDFADVHDPRTTTDGLRLRGADPEDKVRHLLADYLAAQSQAVRAINAAPNRTDPVVRFGILEQFVVQLNDIELAIEDRMDELGWEDAEA